ncbi:hypothetical protein P8452_60298 [Trifolium repens]|nr:hypothetical protein P8452_60298 [Trifolium repens]
MMITGSVSSKRVCFKSSRFCCQLLIEPQMNWMKFVAPLHNSQGYVQEPKQPTRAARMEWCCEESWIGVACFGFSAMLEKRICTGA